MEKKKLYKPKNCELCPAIGNNNKGEIFCLCKRDLKAKITSNNEKLQMWLKCPLAWDKETK